MKRLVAGVVVAGTLTVANSIPTSLTIVSAHTAKQQSSTQAPTPDSIVATARRYLGSPYATIGDSPVTGFSCIGFVHFVFAQNGVNVPFDTPMAWSSAPHVAANELMPGDVLFFSNTVFAGLSHVAIYIGNGQMIGADSFSVGVTTDNLYDRYWQEHYTGATRPLAALGSAPMPGTASTPSQPTATPVPTAPAVVASAAVGAMLQPLSATVGVYSGPGYQYTSLGILAPSAQLVVEQAQDGWYDVRFGNTFGWVNAQDVRPVAGNTTTQSQSIQPTATPDPSPTAAPTPVQRLANAAAVSTTGGSTILVVVQGPLLVRSGPGKNFASIGFVRVGTHLTLLEQRPQWGRVTTPQRLVGWVALQYVSPVGVQKLTKASITQPAAGTPTSGSTARVIASVLNVRAAPQSDARVITVLFAGETVHILGRTSTWYEVRLRSGTVGWASAQWLSAK